MATIINTKNYDIPSKVVTENPLTFSIKCYSIAAIRIHTSIILFSYIKRAKQAIFNEECLSRIDGGTFACQRMRKKK